MTKSVFDAEYNFPSQFNGNQLFSKISVPKIIFNKVTTYTSWVIPFIQLTLLL